MRVGLVQKMGRGELPHILESSESSFGRLGINLGTMRDLKMDRRSFSSIFAFYTILRCLSVGCNLHLESWAGSKRCSPTAYVWTSVTVSFFWSCSDISRLEDVIPDLPRDVADSSIDIPTILASVVRAYQTIPKRGKRFRSIFPV